MESTTAPPAEAPSDRRAELLARLGRRPWALALAAVLLVAGTAMAVRSCAASPDLHVGDRGTHTAKATNGCFELEVGGVIYRTAAVLPGTWLARSEVEGNLEVTDRTGPHEVAGTLTALGETVAVKGAPPDWAPDGCVPPDVN